MLGYRDSGMPDTEANQRPEAFWNAPTRRGRPGASWQVIRRERPQVLITYNDDQQGYPHPDHLRVHDISVLAFERAGDPAWYPELGEPWQPAKLYYTVWSRGRLLAVHEALLRIKGESPFDEKWFERPDRTSGSPPASTSATTCGPAPGRCGPTPPRSTRTRRSGSGSPTRSWPRPTPTRTGSSPRSHVGEPAPRARSRTTCSPASTRAGPLVIDRHGAVPRSRCRKKDEIVTGPDDADLVVTIPVADVGLDPTVAYMQGKLKATGPTRLLFDLLKSGEAATALRDAVADR